MTLCMTMVSMTKMTMTVTVCMTVMPVTDIYVDCDCVCTTMLPVTKMTMTMAVCVSDGDACDDCKYDCMCISLLSVIVMTMSPTLYHVQS